MKAYFFIVSERPILWLIP